MSAAALDVLLCDNHLLAVAKTAGTPVVPDESGDECLLDQARRWVQQEFAKPGAAWLGVVHRLDRPVSGVVLFARTSKAAGRLARQFRERLVLKLYWGVGEGRARAPEGELEQWLLKDAARNRVRAVPPGSDGAQQALTRWRVLCEADGRTLYAFEPATGRPHQLRACAAALGTPLLGDLKYGAREALPDRSVALHARALELAHPTRDERLRIAAPPPAQPIWEIARGLDG